MTDIVERLCETAGQLINGTMQDGDIPVAMLVDASDEIQRLRTALRLARNDMRVSIGEIERELAFSSGNCTPSENTEGSQ